MNVEQRTVLRQESIRASPERFKKKVCCLSTQLSSARLPAHQPPSFLPVHGGAIPTVEGGHKSRETSLSVSGTPQPSTAAVAGAAP